MTRWKSCTMLAFALLFGALGCGGGAGSGVVLTISPTTASVILNTSQQFVSSVTGSTNLTVTWTITCPTGVTAPACGTIDATTGVYQAPGTLPATPTATITATSAADTTKVQTATITIVSAIAILITPSTATVGTGEHTTFTASVSNPGCNSTANPACLNVTWSITSTAGIGSIDANGVFTAPTTLPSTPTVVVTATSVVDTTITANATVTIVTATDPTLTSVSPNTAAQGSVFQDVFLTGTNLIATTQVYINGTQLPSSSVLDLSSSRLLVQIPDQILASPPPGGILSITASQQVGARQTCTLDSSACSVNVVPARPAVVGTSPDTVPQGNAGSIDFNVNGGFFGTGGTVSPVPAVTATYDGQLRGLAVNPNNSARQLAVTIGGSTNPNDFGTPGLHQVEIRSVADATKFAAANLAVQPDINANPPTPVSGSPLTVGTSPIDVAIDPAIGVAVVANKGSNDVTLVDLTTPAPTVTAASICTGSLAPASPCPASGPATVSAAHIPSLPSGMQDVAIVANGTAKNVAVINLSTKAVTALIPLQDAPAGVGINPVTGHALVSMNQRGYGVLLDLTLPTPAVIGVVSISSGPNSHVAVEPNLNWAVATPGGLGTLSIVDLSRQTTNNLASISRTTGTVTVTVKSSTTSAPQPPLGVQVGDAVSIQGVAPDSTTSFNGIYTVTSIGPGSSTFTYSQINTTNPPDVPTTTVTAGQASYSSPVATVGLSPSTVGIAINPETQQAILADPSTGGFVSIFSLLNQTVSSLSSSLGPNIVASAFNPLTNIALVVNQHNNELSVIDPSTPKRIPTSSSIYSTGNGPSAVAIDAASNLAIVTNQTDNTVTIYTLGGIRPVQITNTFPKTFELDSTLTTAPVPPASLLLTIDGKGFTASSVARLDGVNLATTLTGTCSNPVPCDRQLTAIVPSTSLSSAHRFAVDVVNSGPPQVVSNVSDFTVLQSVDVSSGTGCTTAPQPTGVAIDPLSGANSGVAIVSLYGCSSVAVINLSTGMGTTVPVGANPLGVAVLPDIHSAVVANNGAGTASVVNYSGAGSVTSTVSTGSGSFGVATDRGTDEAAVTNSVDNTVTVISVTPSGSSSTNTLSTGQQPIAVAFNYQTHEIAVAAAGGNSVGIGDAGGTSLGTTFSLSVPTSILYDPVANHFLVNSSTSNQLSILDPNTQQQTAFRIGINPTTMAYNYLTSTLVTTNTVSRTLTVVDFLDSTTTGSDRQVRAVLTLPAPPVNSALALTGQLQYGVDIHPFTNLAVVADTANGKVLFIPLPH